MVQARLGRPRRSSSAARAFALGFAVGVLALLLAAIAFERPAGIALSRLIVAVRDAPLVYPDPGNAAGSLVCRDVTKTDAARLGRAFSLVRRTHDGERLADQLRANDVCVTVRPLANALGIAYPQRSFGGWDRSVIVVDRDHLRDEGADVIAATLVHEATHLDRAFRDLECPDGCTVFDNGVALEEEIAAHAAEAVWWISIYGRDGKASWRPADLGMNELVYAFLDGPEAFEEYVREWRSDDPEGES